jgi:hypothetical protein
MLSVLLCSIDSFLASLAIGLLGCTASNQRKFVLAFTACDWGATLSGISLHSDLAQTHRYGLSPFLTPIALAFVVSVVLACSRKCSTILFLLPVLFSFDNFIGGLLDGSSPIEQSPLIAGLVSGLLAWSGFAVARLAPALFSRRNACAASIGLTIPPLVLAK